MTLHLNHFRIAKPYNTLALDQGGSWLNCEGTLVQAIDDISVDTGIASKDCTINEDQGYAVNKNEDWLTVITIGSDHPIAQKINQARQLLNSVYEIAGL